MNRLQSGSGFNPLIFKHLYLYFCTIHFSPPWPPKKACTIQSIKKKKEQLIVGDKKHVGAEGKLQQNILALLDVIKWCGTWMKAQRAAGFIYTYRCMYVLVMLTLNSEIDHSSSKDPPQIWKGSLFWSSDVFLLQCRLSCCSLHDTYTHTHTHLEVSKEEILRSLPFANDLIGVASFLQQLWKQYFRILNSSYYILRCVCCAKQTKISLTLTIMTANSSRPPITRSIITGSGRAVSLKFQHYHSLEVFPEQEMKGASWFSK